MNNKEIINAYKCKKAKKNNKGKSSPDYEPYVASGLLIVLFIAMPICAGYILPVAGIVTLIVELLCIFAVLSLPHLP